MSMIEQQNGIFHALSLFSLLYVAQTATLLTLPGERLLVKPWGLI